MNQPSLDLLVTRLFDYSGMFPPEAKSFEDALHDSARFSTTLARPFLVNTDIVLSFEKLSLLSEDALRVHGFSQRHGITVAALGSPLTDHKDSFSRELDVIAAINHAGIDQQIPIRITSYEIKVDKPNDWIRSVLDEFRDILDTFGISIGLEPDLSRTDWREDLEAAISAIQSHKDIVSIKIRGTGTTGIDTQKITHVISRIADEGLHLKATGGLHHPILEPKQYNNNLGFLNLSMALMLRRTLGDAFTQDAIQSCLDETNPSAFLFSETALGWEDYASLLEVARELKKRYRFSIGSCSLAEPDSDLQRLFS